MYPSFQFDFRDFFEQTVMLWNGSAISMIMLISWITAIAAGIVCYIFQAVGLYSMAKQQGIKPAGLAWVPIVKYYLLGKLSDVVSRAEGQNTHRRVTLLVLYIMQTAFSTGLGVYLLMIFNFLIKFSVQSGYYRPYIADRSFLFATGLIGLFSVILTIAVSILYYVFLMRAVYVILKDRTPKNCALLILLCIFINYAIGPCLFAVRNKPSLAGIRLSFLQRQQEEAEAAARCQREQEAQAAAGWEEKPNEPPANRNEIPNSGDSAE
jgi:hypothetical protein